MKYLKKVTEWEFRPRYIMYIPIFFYRIRLAIKSWTPMFQYFANPGMPPQSMLRFSKRQILKQLDEALIPETYIITPSTPIEELQTYLEKLAYNAIVKPDLWERGNDVVKILSLEQLSTYLHGRNESDVYLLQQYNDYPLEFGVMRYRYPHETTGHISGIVQKVPLVAIWDGVQTVQHLIQGDERLNRYRDLFQERHALLLDKVLWKDESFQLSDIGNHCKGARFYDTSDLATPALIAECDRIASQIQGFHFGRYDFKVPTVEDFRAGKNIIVIEVNGVQSEPAHIYDSAYSLRKAYEQLFAHRNTIYRIGKAHRKAWLSSNIFGSRFSHIFPSKS